MTSWSSKDAAVEASFESQAGATARAKAKGARIEGRERGSMKTPDR
jgi:hypothetical protein